MSHEAIFDERGIANDLLAVFREGRPPVVRGITDVLMGRRREEIVRCRDCAKLMTSYPMWACERFGAYLGTVNDEPNGFCKWGERKDES